MGSALDRLRKLNGDSEGEEQGATTKNEKPANAKSKAAYNKLLRTGKTTYGGKTYTLPGWEAPEPEPTTHPSRADTLPELQRAVEAGEMHPTEALSRYLGTLNNGPTQGIQENHALTPELQAEFIRRNSGQAQGTNFAPNVNLQYRMAQMANRGRAEGTNEEEVAGWVNSKAAPYQGIRDNADYLANTKADEKYAIKGLYSATGKKAKYNYITNLNGFADNAKKSRENELTKYDFMTENERKDYTYIANTQGLDAAEGYLDYLDYDLNARASEAAQAAWAKNAQGTGNAIGASATSVLANSVSGLGEINLLSQNINKLFTGKPVDYNAPALNASKYTQTVRGQVAKDIEKAHPNATVAGVNLGSFLYQTGMSMADSAVVALLGRFGVPNPGIILGSSAAVNATLNAKERGLTDAQALTTGLASGIAEMLFEEVSLEKIIHPTTAKSVGGVVLNILRQAFTEGSEEVATTLANTLTDALINGDKSEILTRQRELQAQGMSEEEARKAAWKEWGIGLITDALGGAISGGVMGTGANVANYMSEANYRRTGDAYRQMGLTNDEFRDALVNVKQNTYDQYTEEWLNKLTDRAARGEDLMQKLPSAEIGKVMALQAGLTNTVLTQTEYNRIARLNDAPYNRVTEEAAQTAQETQEAARTEEVPLPARAENAAETQARPLTLPTAETTQNREADPLGYALDKKKSGKRLNAQDARAIIENPEAIQALRDAGVLLGEVQNNALGRTKIDYAVSYLADKQTGTYVYSTAGGLPLVSALEKVWRGEPVTEADAREIMDAPGVIEAFQANGYLTGDIKTGQEGVRQVMDAVTEWGEKQRAERQEHETPPSVTLPTAEEQQEQNAPQALTLPTAESRTAEAESVQAGPPLPSRMTQEQESRAETPAAERQEQNAPQTLSLPTAEEQQEQNAPQTLTAPTREESLSQEVPKPLTLPTAESRTAETEEQMIERLKKSPAGLSQDEYTATLDQRTVKLLDTLAKKLGLRVAFADEVNRGKANADITGNVVLIEKGNPNPVRFLIGHEATHWMKRNADGGYNAFEKAARKADAVWFQNREAEIRQVYQKQGVSIDEAGIREEALSDYAGLLADNSDTLERFITENKDDRGVLEKVRDFFRHIKEFLTGDDRAKVERAERRLLQALQQTERNVASGKAKGVERSSDPAKTIGDSSGLEESYTKYSLNANTYDYAKAYTGVSKQTETAWDSIRELGEIQKQIGRTIRKDLPAGHWRMNIHNLNEYLAKHPDIWQRLVDIQTEANEKGIAVDFVTPVQESWEIEGQKVEGGLKGFPIEYRKKKDGSYVFNGFARTLSQLFVDRMDPRVRGKMQDEFIAAVEDAYNKRLDMADPAPKLKKMLDAVAGPVAGRNIASKTKNSLQTALRSASKTVMALNFNSACPMFTVGNHGCYLDACYLTQMGAGGNTVNLFQSAIYGGEILQLSQNTIDLLNSDPDGLRVNGVGDTIADNKAGFFAALRHAEMRGLKLKIITKQTMTLDLLREAKKQGIDISNVTVQLSMDNLWLPADLDDAWGSGIRGTVGIADTLRTNKNFEAASVAYDEFYGRQTKEADGVLYRKYGFDANKVLELIEDYPEINILPRYVVTTAPEIAELALGNGPLGEGPFIQTLMHGVVPEECVSDYPGKVLNFGAVRHAIEKNADGEWEFFGAKVQKTKGDKSGKGTLIRVNSKAHKIVDDYIKDHYTKAQQETIYTNLQKQICCKASENVDACAGCQSLYGGGCSLCSSVKAGKDFDYTPPADLQSPASDIVSETVKKLRAMVKAQNKDEGKTKYSMKEADTDYLAAVDRGNTAAAQKMVDEAAKKAGYDIKAYHGTSNYGFTRFDNYFTKFGLFGNGFYFTESPEVAESYTKKGKGTNPGVYSVFLKADNLIDMDAPADLSKWRKGFRDFDFDESYLDGVSTNEDAFRALKEAMQDAEMYQWEAEETVPDFIREMGYDGITHMGGGRYGSKDGPSHRVYIVYDSSQIKSADPVTYDKDDKPISLSERFNPENDDIRYSLKGLDADAIPESVRRYGRIKPGENPARDVQVPKKVTGDKRERVSQTIRTVLEAGATPDAAVPTISELVEKGAYSYPVYSDKDAIAKAEGTIKDKGWEATLTEWVKDVSDGTVSKTNTAMGWALYNNAANKGDLDTALNVLDLIVRHQRNAAQAVQATRILKQLTPEAQLYGVQRSVDNLIAEIKQKYGKDVDIQVNRDLARAFLNAKTEAERRKALEALYKDVGRQLPSRFIDKWNAWRYLAMLGNPRTHVRNIVGNAGFAPVVLVKDQVGTMLESIVYHLSGGKTERTKGLVLPGWDHKLVKAAWNRYDEIMDEALGAGKYTDMKAANDAIQEGRVIFKFKPLEWARRANSAALDKEDIWFNKPHYVYALAQYCKANDITPAQIASGKGLEKAEAYAIKEAQKATYRDINAFSNFVSSIGRSTDRKTPVGKVASAVIEGILPFRRTPANILARGVEYSPLGLAKSLTYDMYQVMKKDADGNPRMTVAEMLDDVSAGLTGTGLLALGMLLAKLGLLRGHGKDEEKARNFDDLTGHQNYALQLPNGDSYTLDWLAPESLPVFVGVNLYERMLKTKGEMKMNDLLQAVSSISEPMLEMSMLQGINDLLETVSFAKNQDTSALFGVLSEATISYLTQAFPTLLGQSERTGENIRMTTYTDKNKWLTPDIQYSLGKVSAKIPGWDYDQIPYIDAWGRTEVTGDGWLERAFKNMINPGYTDTVRMSDMEKELLRLYNLNPEDNGGVLPTRPGRKIGDTDLTGEQYVKYATKKGQLSYELATGIIKSAAYKKATDDEKVALIKDAFDYANERGKAEAISGYKTSESKSWITKMYQTVKKTKVDEATYLSARYATSQVKGIPDDNGEMISNSAGLKKMDYLYGLTSLTDSQREAMMADFGVGEKLLEAMPSKEEVKERLTFIEAGIPDSEYKDYKIASGVKGIDLDTYMKGYNAYYDADGSGTKTNADWTAVLDEQTFSKDKAQDNYIKGVLWQLYTNSTSTKNNPYDKSGGQYVLDEKDKAKGGGGKSGGDKARIQLPTQKQPWEMTRSRLTLPSHSTVREQRPTSRLTLPSRYSK